MKKRHVILSIAIVILLITILSINVHKNREYAMYLKQENENSINAILSIIESNNEILNKYEETGAMTYSEFSRIGNSSLNAEKQLSDLQRQVKYFVSEKKYSHEDFNTIRSYFDSVSMWISMDLLQGIGNYYPHMYNDDVYDLNQDEKLILGYLVEINRRFINDIEANGFINNESNGKKYYVDPDDNNGLGHLIKLVDALTIDVKEQLKELESYDNNLVEGFLSRVN